MLFFQREYIFSPCLPTPQNYSSSVRLWPLTNEIVANHSPHNLDELEELLVYRCQQLLEQHDLIRGLTCYHWWPMTRAA